MNTTKETKDSLRSRATYDNGIVVAAGGVFPAAGRTQEFFIMPLADTGIVVCTTVEGQEISHALPVTTYQVKMKFLAAGTLVDVLVMW